MPNEITRIEVCCIEIVRPATDSQPAKRLGCVLSTEFGWEAWAVSPYDAKAMRCVGKHLHGRIEAEKLVVSCTEPWVAKGGRK